MGQLLAGNRSLLFLGLLFVRYPCLQAQDVRQYLEAPVNPRSDIPCPSPDQYSPLRPDPAGTPTIVGVTMMFQDISRLNDVEQTMTADVYIIVRWRDPRLTDPARGDGSADCAPPGKALWMPAVEPENLRSRQAFYSQRFLVDANGTVTLVQRLVVEVANPLDLHDFPFDRHAFEITLWPTISRADEVAFHPLNKWLTINQNLSVLGWKVSPPAATVREDNRFGRLGAYSRYDVFIGMRARDWRFYAWKLGVPLLLIVLMDYGVYYIPPTGVAQQVALGMTSMLTLIAYMLTLGGSLPKISYLTRADKLFVGCAIIVFRGWAFLVAIALANRLRVGHPVAYVALALGVWAGILASGVHASYLNQPIEVEELRPEVERMVRAPGRAQLILRLGYGHAVAPTPRRPVEEVLLP